MLTDALSEGLALGIDDKQEKDVFLLVLSPCLSFQWTSGMTGILKAASISQRMVVEPAASVISALKPVRNAHSSLASPQTY